LPILYAYRGAPRSPAPQGCAGESWAILRPLLKPCRRVYYWPPDVMQTWDSKMENAKKALAELQQTFRHLAAQSGLVRDGGGDLVEIERLLNSTLELTESIQSLALAICVMAGIGSGRTGYEKLVDFAIGTNHQCLLMLLVDGSVV